MYYSVIKWKFCFYSFLFFSFLTGKNGVVWVIVTYYKVLISFVFKVQHYYTTNPGLILLVCEQNHNTYERVLILCIFYVMNFPWLGHIIQVGEQKRFIFQRSWNLWAWEWKLTYKRPYKDSTIKGKLYFMVFHMMNINY